MEKFSPLVAALLCIAFAYGVNGYIKYNTGSGIIDGKLNVHLVPHSHDDVGWLKTVDQYYVGSNNSIQGACVENILDSVVMSLRRDPNRKFAFAEMAFFDRWWKRQNPEIQEDVRKLVDAGQLEFVNGGWCMHDEAATHYIDMIDQTTLGHQLIKNQFNKAPRAGWQIDPFGHSAVQAYLLGVELGFDSVHFARIDYQDRGKRQKDKSLEVIWRASRTFGSSSQDGRVNALYSTPSFYVDAKCAANESWPLKTDDYFPYAISANTYFTGFFTSRPSLKRYIRMLSGYYLAARQIEFLLGRRSAGPNTYSLSDALGIAQHHDAITGTSRLHTTSDYAKRLAIGASEAEITVSSALSCLIDSKSNAQCAKPTMTFSQCQLLNISFCPATEADIPKGKSLVVVAYNPLGWERIDFVRIPVNDHYLVVKDSTGKIIESQYIVLDNITSNMRRFYVEAYIGISPEEAPKYWLFFQVSVPPLGWNTYFISKASQKGNSRSVYVPMLDPPKKKFIEIGPGNLKLSFSSASGELERMFNSKSGLMCFYQIDMPVQQSYLWYASSEESESSDAYHFRPNGSTPQVVLRSVPLKVTRGPLVHEVHQQFDSWIYQITRIYKDREHAEVEFTIGPIPTENTVGKEIITRMTTSMSTKKAFYTDSNARDFLKRVRDYRSGWNLTVTQPVAGNYYPINLGIFIADNKSELSVLVDRATGGSSINDGEIELMLHRRIIKDDTGGLVEPLDELVCVNSTCEGLMIRGNYYMSINERGTGSRWRRKTGQEIYSPLLLAFSHESAENWISSHLTKATAMDPNYSLPLNVALITLQELVDGNVLLRLAHLYEASEDEKYSSLAKVELKKMFTGKTIKALKETSLSANQDKSEMKRMTWEVEGQNGNDPDPIRGGPMDMSTLIVELGPMEIRTFLLRF
ncbi:alpha-mannosidase-like isoform X4 [Olea europaea var. sylvestris]|uniref:alpha-mannosidase-like isoform X4 n=1 Tax=Olea europaea var. sylvestris TaxID=158386 RepID=UPI000C1D1486|nr:alpha-mannosidase-like isoform X4 [Olea europaea var. sylvestris]